MRAPFFQAVIIPIVLGTAVAWYSTGRFHAGYFLLALLGGIFMNAGTNLANDYFDYKSGADNINTQFTTFSGGSRVIQDGLISANVIYKASLLFFILAAVVGLYFVWISGWPILVIGIIGLLSGYFYTAGPVKTGYRGWGELVVGLNFGPLAVSGAYYIQTKTVGLEALAASIPMGILIAAVLYINEFADYEPDKLSGKNTLVVIMGPDRAIKGYYLLLASAYFAVILGVVIKIIPLQGLVCLLTLPLAWKAVRTAGANYTDTKGLKPAMANTIAIHLTVGLLLSLGYLAAGIFA